jgi:hypothetical protein
MKDNIKIMPATILENTIPDDIVFQLIHDFSLAIRIIPQDDELKFSIHNEVRFSLGTNIPVLYNFKTGSDFYIPVCDRETLSALLPRLINRSVFNFNVLWSSSGAQNKIAPDAYYQYLSQADADAIIQRIVH